MFGEVGEDVTQRPPKLNITLPTLREINVRPLHWSDGKIRSKLPTDILLLTTNDHEFIACYYYLKERGSIERGYSMELGLVDFGEFGDEPDQKARVALMKRPRGSDDTQVVVTNAAQLLRPKVTLFVGICGTMNPKKAKLGDVVISWKLADDRGDTKAKVSKNIADLILHAAEGWTPPLIYPDSFLIEVHRDALMLSVQQLINNRKKREELLNAFRDALGVEMEGAGLYAAAFRLEMEWAVIRGVSDYADGSSEKTKLWQPFSSVMAASVVHHMFKNPVVIRDWPRCKSSRKDWCICM